MQRDVMAHRPSEVDGLVYEVVRMAHRYQVPVPAYEKVAQKLQGEIMCEKNSHTEGNKKGRKITGFIVDNESEKHRRTTWNTNTAQLTR